MTNPLPDLWTKFARLKCLDSMLHNFCKALLNKTTFSHLFPPSQKSQEPRLRSSLTLPHWPKCFCFSQAPRPPYFFLHRLENIHHSLIGQNWPVASWRDIKISSFIHSWWCQVDMGWVYGERGLYTFKLCTRLHHHCARPQMFTISCIETI